MLEAMRNNAKHVLWPLTIVCIIGMGGWGVWYLVAPEESPANLAGKIWGRNVYLDEFLKIYQGSRLLAGAGGRNPDQKALMSAAWRQLLLEGAADKAGIPAARSEIALFIGSIPFFRGEKGFDPARYLAILTNFGLGEKVFEDFVASLIKAEKLVALIGESSLVSPAEIEDFYQRSQSRVRFDYVLFLQEDTPEPEPAPREQLQEFYEANRAAFQVPPRAEITYLLIPFSAWDGKVAVEETRVEEYYASNPAEFAGQTGAPATLEEVRGEIREKLLRQDEISLENAGAELGFQPVAAGPFADGEPIGELGTIEEVNREAFRMSPGEVSYPIEFAGGFIFFRLEKISEPRMQAFEEAEGKIAAELAARERARLTREKAEAALEAIQKKSVENGFNFMTAAAEAGLNPLSSPLISAEDEDLDPPIPANLLSAAFLTPTGMMMPELVPVEGGFAFFQVTGREAPGPMPEADAELWKERARQIKQAVVGQDWLFQLGVERESPGHFPHFFPDPFPHFRGAGRGENLGYPFPDPAHFRLV